jgi:hypothetical protein
VSAYLTTPSAPVVGTPFGVTVTVSTPSFIASAVQVEPYLSYVPGGVVPLDVRITRLDGTPMSFPDARAPVTLGNIMPMLSRSATFYYRAVTPGPKNFYIRVSWENGGEQILHTTLQVAPDMSTMSDLIRTAMAPNPSAPARAPGRRSRSPTRCRTPGWRDPAPPPRATTSRSTR